MLSNAIFTKPVNQAKVWATTEMLVEVSTSIKELPERRELLSKGYTDNLQYAIGWIIHRMPHGEVAEILNTLAADEQYLQVIVGKLAIRLQIGALPINNFNYEVVKSMVAYQIIQTLIDLGHIEAQSKTRQERDEETGQIKWSTQTLLTFGGESPVQSLHIPGVHPVPGQVMQKRLKVRNGGKALKLNKAEKNVLRTASSTPLTLIDIDPQEIGKYLRQSKWYQEALHAKDIYKRIDRLVLEEVVEQQVAKFTEMQKLDCFYLSMWLDYRTRLYYDMTEMGFNPHGKLFETSLYELAEAREIDDRGADALKYSAVCIVDGRTPHHTAIQRFDASPSHYVDALRVSTGDMGEDLYNSRLSDALMDYYNKVPSRFLLAEDATNGGLQHGGIGFKSPKMMYASNVGGSDHQEDSHGWLQQELGLDARDEAKKIHQPLLHGSSIHTVAKVINKSVEQTRDLLIHAYGNEVLNISAVADWGVAVASNENTTLMWDTRDGLRAQSIAYTESVPLELYALTGSTLKGYSQCKIHKEMPILKDAKGNPIYGNVGSDHSMGKQNKLRGLYANITHSIDGTALRDVMRELESEGQYGLYKHDNFLVHPNDMHIVRRGYKKAILAEYDYEAYDQAIDGIIENYEGIKPPRPIIFKGTATRDLIEKSHYFLSA